MQIQNIGQLKPEAARTIIQICIRRALATHKKEQNGKAQSQRQRAT